MFSTSPPANVRNPEPMAPASPSCARCCDHDIARYEALQLEAKNLVTGKRANVHAPDDSPRAAEHEVDSGRPGEPWPSCYLFTHGTHRLGIGGARNLGRARDARSRANASLDSANASAPFAGGAKLAPELADHAVGLLVR